jgi:hypothetical protein
MSISNLKEYARLTMAIKKARAEGKNLDELLTLREKLVNRTIPKKPKKIKIKSREEINRKYYQKHRGWLLDHKKERHEEKREEEEEQR